MVCISLVCCQSISRPS